MNETNKRFLLLSQNSSMSDEEIVLYEEAKKRLSFAKDITNRRLESEAITQSEAAQKIKGYKNGIRWLKSANPGDYIFIPDGIVFCVNEHQQGN